MAEFIPRDLSSPFDPADEQQIAEFEGFACDVPNTDGMIDAVNLASGATRANAVRAARLFAPGFLAGLVGGVNDLPTPDRVAPSPNATFERRGLHDQELHVAGTDEVVMWSFEARVNRGADVDSDDREGWPAPTIRVREGEIVHSTLGSSQGPHTIHHHGIEPTPVNDGVGHLSFEVAAGQYLYQWQAAEAGTYFYHCHRNTTLHFEMGMYGMLIVDPDVPGAPFADGGPGMTLLGNSPVNYDVEAIWVGDDIDSFWHEHFHVADGLQDCDNDGRSGFVRIDDDDNPRLHDFNPDVFVVSGQAAPAADDGVNLIPAVGATIIAGQKLLVRFLNASYCTQVWKFPTSLSGTVTATDGRTYGRSDNGFGSYSQPYSLASVNHQFTLTTAQRHDVLIDTAGATPGQHLVALEFRHWITHQLLRTVRVPINVVAA
jgi:FtsP/CotA-like multicopper oxidase with cupredoxin domain